MQKAVNPPTKRYGFKHDLQRSLRRNWALYLLVIPGLLYFILFLYWPMYGVIIAFKDYSPSKGIIGSPWAAYRGTMDIFKHFKSFFTSIHFYRTLRNTVQISLYTLAVGFPIPLVLAILMNELQNRRFKQIVQTVTYLPHFISTIVLCGMLWIFMRSETGLFNILRGKLGLPSISFLNDGRYFKSIYVWSGVWQNAGSFMSVGFEKVFALQTDLTLEASDVISTLVYRKGILETSYSFSSAVGLFNSLINCFLLLTVNFISRKAANISLF